MPTNVGVGVAALGVGGTYCAYKIGKAIYEWGDDAIDFLKEQPVDDEGNKGPPRWARWLISFGREEKFAQLEPEILADIRLIFFTQKNHFYSTMQRFSV